jgi:hypothetical protein
MEHNKSIQSKVAKILRDTGRPECMEKAEQLTRKEIRSKALNLKSLDLQAHEVLEIAKALKDIDGQKGDYSLESISLSYNNVLNDEGVLTLLPNLPLSIRELGLVQCGIGEVGGRALLDWVVNAPNLEMICAEQNAFSHQLKLEYVHFSIANPQVIVVV